MLKQKEWIDVIVTKTGCTKKDAKAKRPEKQRQSNTETQ